MTRREFFKSFYRIRIAGPTGQQASRARRVERVMARRFALRDLSQLPDSVLAGMVPAVRADMNVVIEEAGVTFRVNDHGGFVGLGPRGSTAIRLFDGKRTVQQIATALDTTSEQADGFALARDAFVALAAEGLCQPAGPPR